MALKKTVSFTGTASLKTEDGIFSIGEQSVSINAYIKVLSLNGGKEQLRILVGFSEGQKQFAKHYSFAPSVESGASNFIAQAYEYLKTLPEFAGAFDC